jgi:hypothetical protein
MYTIGIIRSALLGLVTAVVLALPADGATSNRAGGLPSSIARVAMRSTRLVRARSRSQRHFELSMIVIQLNRSRKPWRKASLPVIPACRSSSSNPTRSTTFSCTSNHLSNVFAQQLR